MLYKGNWYILTLSIFLSYNKWFIYKVVKIAILFRFIYDFLKHGSAAKNLRSHVSIKNLGRDAGGEFSIYSHPPVIPLSGRLSSPLRYENILQALFTICHIYVVCSFDRASSCFSNIRIVTFFVTIKHVWFERRQKFR